MNDVKDIVWRTVAYQEVRLRIGPLAKLGCYKSTAENFLVYFVTISLAKLTFCWNF